MGSINNTISSFNREEEEARAQAEASFAKISYANLQNIMSIPRDGVAFFPKEDVLRLKFIPYLKVGNKLKIGSVTPQDQALIDLITKISAEKRLETEIVKISDSSFASAYKIFETTYLDFYGPTKKIPEFYSKINDIINIAEEAKKASTSDLLELLIYGAEKSESSDIHIEPEETEFIIRYRIDGMLTEVVRLPSNVFKQLLSRIMLASGMKLDITEKPQDGGMTTEFPDGTSVDIRVSIMPSTYGLSIVMRLLGEETSIRPLDNFGFRPDALAAIKEAISHPHGMILTSGPTGSGKSSTMYSVILYLRKPDVKIITLENPVEIKISGVEQSQVTPGEGYEFADGLRSSLRQDPDILMVGEIRDPQTAEIAIQAAMTGHLLLSTVHANSAPAVFIRLLEIGVRPFLLAGSINLIMAQRLIRKICPKCKEQYQPSKDEWQFIINKLAPAKNKLAPEIINLLSSPSPVLFRAKGCPECNNSGYKGRQVVIEYIVPDEKIEALIAKNTSIVDFEQAAVEQGIITMEQDGILKVLEGVSTLEEVLRVTKS